MKALTICQPYAELILRRDKLVENRNWSTHYRGPLLIHAGKSRKWLLDYPEVDLPDGRMDFGAIVGVCDLVGCCSPNTIRCAPQSNPLAWIWLKCPQHVCGPFCLVLRDICRFGKPIPYRGQQGLFEIPDSVVAEAMA